MIAEKKYKLKRYTKILLPLLMIVTLIVGWFVKIEWSGMPSTVTVDSKEIQKEFKDALSHDKMLTIHGKTDRITYEWFYDVGSIQSIYETNLTIYETGQWEQKVSDSLRASNSFVFQFSKDIQLNGLPVLTIKLLHQNTEDIALYHLEDGNLTFISNPIVNLMPDGAEITYPVYDTKGIFCLVSDVQNKVAATSIYEKETTTDNEILSFNDSNSTGKSQDIKLEETAEQSQNVESASERPTSLTMSEDNKQETLMVVDKEAFKDNQSVNDDKNNANSKTEVSSDSSEMEQLLQNADKDSLAKVKVPDGKITQSSPTKNENSSENQKLTNTDTGKLTTSVMKEDKKPKGQGSSLTASGTTSSGNRVISDGKQTQKDQYETDPVPEGKPLPVEPKNRVVDYKKSYSCTLSIDCLTIKDHMSDLNPEKTSFVPDSGYIFEKKKVIFYEGESVFDVLLRETQKAGIQMEYSMTPIYNSNYIEGINNLYEFDCGNLSGWMYSVDGWYPNYGCSRYMLKDGEVIQWRYTCDLGRDVGCDWLDKTK
ncbi:MAG: DUF4430 domain-containing protein [Clostridiales bacterium]|nr:DUF4430 domain-containing protein [Clostridiales bacterium]